MTGVFMKASASVAPELVEAGVSLEPEGAALRKAADMAGAAALLGFPEGAGSKPPWKSVLLNINASSLCLNRHWPAESFKTLAERLLEDEGLRVYLTGGRPTRHMLAL